MTSEPKQERSLRAIELEVLEKGANGRADAWSKGSRTKPTATAEFSPLSGRKVHHRRKEPMGLRTVAGGSRWRSGTAKTRG